MTGRGPGRPRTVSGRGPGRPPLSRAGSDILDQNAPQKRRGRPPLNGVSVLRKGLDRSRKVLKPNICHLCHLAVAENEELDSCRTYGTLAHEDCEKATGEDCGTY